MEYRTLPHGGEKISVIGLGMGSIHEAASQIPAILQRAFDAGINYLDICPSQGSALQAYAPFIRQNRNQLYLQMHFGANYDSGAYGWTRNLDSMKRTFEGQLNLFDTDHTDMGYVHCIDEDGDFNDIMREGGLWDYLCSLKRQGAIHHLGFSTHNASIAYRFLDTDLVDMFMFSVNPTYDFDSDGRVSTERANLYRTAEKLGVGMSIMKSFGGGQLLDARRSPFHQAFSIPQLFQYALDRPGALCVLPGVRSMQDLEDALAYLDASAEDRDYSGIIAQGRGSVDGTCVYCSHCHPCPAGIDIALVNKYYDLALLGDKLAFGHYSKLSLKADACTGCGHCDTRCPFHVEQSARMKEIDAFFSR